MPRPDREKTKVFSRLPKLEAAGKQSHISVSVSLGSRPPANFLRTLTRRLAENNRESFLSLSFSEKLFGGSGNEERGRAKRLAAYWRIQGPLTCDNACRFHDLATTPRTCIRVYALCIFQGQNTAGCSCTQTIVRASREFISISRYFRILSRAGGMNLNLPSVGPFSPRV